MLAYQLDKQLSGEKILTDIQQLIHKNITDNKKDMLLVIKIQEVSYEDTSCIPKLLYNP